MVKNIIFDLGGVLLNLEPARTHSSFSMLLGEEKFQALKKELDDTGFFDKFDTGQIDEELFYFKLQSYGALQMSRHAIYTSWNAMLLDFPKERVDLLAELRSKGFGLYLFSNTNEIHENGFRKIIRETHGGLDLDELFDMAFYSHHIGHRKPDVKAFQYVLEEAGISASEAFFIDDNAQNVEGARKAGIQAFLHEPNTDLRRVLELNNFL